MHQAALRAEATRIDDALSFLTRARSIAAAIDSGVTLYDPVPANLVRLAGLERAHLTVQARSRTALQRFLRAWIERLYTTGVRDVRWALDVDPLEL